MVKMARKVYLIAEYNHSDRNILQMESELVRQLNVGVISLETPYPKGGFYETYKSLANKIGAELIPSESPVLFSLHTLLDSEVESALSNRFKFFPGTKEYKIKDNELAEILKEVKPLDEELLKMRNEHTVSVIEKFLSNGDEGKDSLAHICGLGHVPHLKELLKEKGFDVETYVVSRYGTINLEKNNILYAKGDLLESNVDLIAHGVAEGKKEDMGTGIAKQIKQYFPGSFKRFDEFRRNNKFAGGDVWVDELSIPAIAYIATQPDLIHAEIDYLEKGLKNLRDYIKENNVPSVGLPKIGCGYGKLDWKEVKPLIERYLSGLDSLVLVFV
jgi:O-acetyl-ADP-ribose deacetylase (regulator of RNase III)